MRCNNCGWDNPGENVKCEKCNAPLSRCKGEEESARTVYVPEEYNSKATAIGCSECGYPVRPSDTECPVCGHSFTGNVIEVKANKTPAGGTIIQGTPADKENGSKDRRKLVAFLVTYSHAPNGEFFPIYEGKNMIGRDSALQISIQGDPNISERHLSVLFRPVDCKFKFKDEQSSNGTFINEVLTDEGELKNLDVIRIGETKLIFMEIPRG